MIAKAFGVRYAVEPIVGLSRARNTGAAHCTADVVAYTDDDAVPERDWIAHLADPFRDQRVMAVGGRIGHLAVDTEGGISSNDHADISNRSRTIRSIGRENPNWFEMANFGALGDGGNQAIRRRAFEVWNGFDVRLGRGTTIGGGEDHFSLFELLELGYRVVYAPRAVVRHPLPRTIAEILRRRQTVVEEFVAYSAFLATVRPKYALRVLRYGAQAMMGARRRWQPDRPPRSAVGSGWLLLLRGIARGLRRFFASRAANHDRHRRARGPVDFTAGPHAAP
jgi:glycosyltransferase involved in cell wall biosynthesis